jgi:hypothetical protein
MRGESGQGAAVVALLLFVALLCVLALALLPETDAGICVGRGGVSSFTRWAPDAVVYECGDGGRVIVYGR